MLAFFNALSPWHLLLIGVVAILLFGNRLPEVARSLGRSVNEFKRGLKEVKEDFDDAVSDDTPREKLDAPPDQEEAKQIDDQAKVKEPSESGQTDSR
jgi:sec-independent protein translocase protein TatA